MAEDFSLACAGEQALIVYLYGDDAERVSARVQALTAAVEAALGDLLVDLVPSYASLLVIYDALRTDHFQVGASVRRCARASTASAVVDAGKVVEIPVYYAPESGPDLEAVAAESGLAVDEVIGLHSGRDYRVYAIGFAPGFAYLGELDERLALPRLATPRVRVPRGSVAIADRQTAVYPAASPGGWRLLGRSPLRMFNPEGDPPMPVSVGDRVRFVPIARDVYLAAGGEL
jgi:KipI family sensor histidine kinase inhibitor